MEQSHTKVSNPTQDKVIRRVDMVPVLHFQAPVFRMYSYARTYNIIGTELILKVITECCVQEVV